MIWAGWDLLVCIIPSCSGLPRNVMRAEKNHSWVNTKYLSTLGLVYKVFSVGHSWNQILSSFCFPFLCEWSPNYKPEHYKPTPIEQEPGRTKVLLCSAVNPGLYSFYPLFEQFFPIRDLPGARTVARRGEVFSPISKTASENAVYEISVSSFLSKMISLLPHICQAGCIVPHTDHCKWQAGQCFIGRLSKCKGEFQFERVTVRKGWKGEALTTFFSQVYKDSSYASYFIFRNFVYTDQTPILFNKVVPGSAFLTLECKCIGFFTSSFILVWYVSFNLVAKVCVFVCLVCLWMCSPSKLCCEMPFWKRLGT